MNARILPPRVTELLRERVQTYEELEILLALQADRSRAWTADEAASVVRVPASAASAALAALCRRQLITADRTGSAFRFAAAPYLANTVAELAQIASQSRLPIIRVMNAHAVERLRLDAARAFR